MKAFVVTGFINIKPTKKPTDIPKRAFESSLAFKNSSSPYKEKIPNKGTHAKIIKFLSNFANDGLIGFTISYKSFNRVKKNAKAPHPRLTHS